MLWNFLINSVLPIFLALILPLFLIPFIMRFFISHLVLWQVKRKYLPQYVKEVSRGWKTEKEKSAIINIVEICRQRLKYYLVFKPQLKDDLNLILLLVKNIYHPQTDPEKVKLNFSIKRLIMCCLLAFSDIYRDYEGQPWFRIIQNRRAIWFYRFNNIRKYYEILFSLPIINSLKKTRLLGKIIRLILIPLIGAPSLIFYLLKSILFNIAYEGFYRFLYALIIMKFGYYTLYLYGKENEEINTRIKTISKEKIKNINESMEQIINFKNWQNSGKIPSKLFNIAIQIYQDFLKEFQIKQDKFLLDKKEQFYKKAQTIIMDLAKAISQAASTAYKKHNPLSPEKISLKQKIIILYKRISGIYYPRAKIPILNLRLREIITIGYMASVILLNRIMSTPGVSTLIDKISIDFALKIKDLSQKNIIKKGLQNIKKMRKAYNIYWVGSKAYRIIRGIAAPYTMIWSLGSPVLFQQLQNMIQEFIFHRTGRLLLYAWETHRSKKKQKLTPFLW